MLLFAAETADVLTALGIPATGVSFGLLVWYLVTKQIPSMQKANDESREKERQDFARLLEAKDKREEKITNFIFVMLQRSMAIPEMRNDPQIKQAVEGLKEATKSATE